jgi:hypothetical protein
VILAVAFTAWGLAIVPAWRLMFPAHVSRTAECVVARGVVTGLAGSWTCTRRP